MKDKRLMYYYIWGLINSLLVCLLLGIGKKEVVWFLIFVMFVLAVIIYHSGITRNI